MHDASNSPGQVQRDLTERVMSVIVNIPPCWTVCMLHYTTHTTQHATTHNTTTQKKRVHSPQGATHPHSHEFFFWRELISDYITLTFHENIFVNKLCDSFVDQRSRPVDLFCCVCTQSLFQILPRFVAISSPIKKRQKQSFLCNHGCGACLLVNRCRDGRTPRFGHGTTWRQRMAWMAWTLVEQ